MKSRKVEFQIPQGYSVPEGTTAGEEFDVLCTMRVKKDGSVCLVKMGDTLMPGYNDKTETRPSYQEYASQMQQSGQQQ